MKIGFDALLRKFDSMGEKTGWTYIEIPRKISDKLKPGYKKSFRVKGLLDEHAVKSVALIPMGDGKFIMAINATMRKAIRKNKGQSLAALLALDEEEIPLSVLFLECLADDPGALINFKRLPSSHQQYYSKWIESAKTDATKAKRIAMAVNGLARNMDYGAMLREERDNRPTR